MPMIAELRKIGEEMWARVPVTEGAGRIQILSNAEIAENDEKIARLLEQSGLADAAIDELTKEREMYRMRWLGSMSVEDAALIRAENERLRAAASKLAREVKASFELFEPLARREMGNSNYQIIMDDAAAVLALTSTGEQDVSK